MAGRSVILSGQHNRTCTRGIGNVAYAGGKKGSCPMPDYPARGRLHFSNATLPDILRQSGYRTAAIGKWHVYTWPDVIGFDQYVIPRTHHVHSTQHYVENGGQDFVPAGWSVEFETSRARQFIEAAPQDEALLRPEQDELFGALQAYHESTPILPAPDYGLRG